MSATETIPTLQQVKQNLVFYNLWTDVHEISLSTETVLKGTPNNKLLGDEVEEGQPEIVLPVQIDEAVSPRRLNSVFEELQLQHGVRPKRLVLGIVNDEGTVVYYFVHDGVAKPKKN